MKWKILILFICLTTNCLLSQGEIDVSSFESCSGPIRITEINDNLSGITYDYENDRFYAVTNSPARMYKLSIDGEIEVTYQLNSFGDTEGIVYLGNDEVATVEERDKDNNIIQKIVFFQIPQGNNSTYTIDFTNDIIDTIVLNIGSVVDNKGLEGIAYDQNSDIMYVCQEIPPRLFSFSNYENKLGNSIAPTEIILNLNDMDDFAGLHFESNSLFILSEDSNRIVELDLNTLDVKSELNDLEHPDPEEQKQPEGITFTSKDQAIIVSESNEFIKYNRQEYPLGDVNLDGSANIIDALFITQYDVSVRTNIVDNPCDWDPESPWPIYLKKADVNDDGFVDVIDALFISQCEAALHNVMCPN